MGRSFRWDPVRFPAILRRSAAAFLVVGLVGCSADCGDQGSCLPSGTYIEGNAALDTASARICFDDVCETADPLAGSGGIFKSDFWSEGRTVQLRLTVFDSENIVIDTLTEERKMDSARCGCGVLYYVWEDGHLKQTN
jgi:hypothetical protein